MATKKPKTCENNGKDANGRFIKGNQCGRNSKKPLAKMRAELQQALAASVSQKDIMDIVKALVEKAKKGDTFAAREVLDRCCGKAEQPVTGNITVNVVNYTTYNHGDGNIAS